MSVPELVTMHTHSTFCNHATDTLQDMVEAAAQAGITTMAATEHYPVPDAIDTPRHASMPHDRLESYIAAVHEQQDRHPNIELLLGCELDWLGPDEERDLSAASFEAFDIVLGSVHFIDKWLFNSSKFKERWNEVDVDALWLRYIDLWCEAATSDWPITVMAHPDVIKKFGHYPRFDLAPHYERMAEAAAAGGRMVEVNTSGRFHPCTQYYPAPDLLRAFRRAGVACTVGTDAHRATHIARDILEAYDYMHAAGYRSVTVLERGGNRREIALS